MTKNEFLRILGDRLSGLPADHIDETLSYFAEMIDDGIEDGLSEDEAVSALGDIDTIAQKARADIPLSRLVREKVKPKRALRAWEILCLVLGSPIWLSLLIAAVVVILSLYIVLWSLVIVVFSVMISFIAAAVVGLFESVILMISGMAAQSILFVGAALICAGLSIFTFHGGSLAARGSVFITKRFFSWIKGLFSGKERAK